MSWAGNQRLLIISSIVFVAIIVVGGVLALTLPKEPSCSDGIQNQDEQGIDCGGGCAYLCSADVAKPTDSYVVPLEQNGRIDVVALVKNNEPSAYVNDARYVVELFTPEGALLASKEGVMDLPPGEEVAVYIPGVAASGLVVDSAFLTFKKESLNFTRGTFARALPRADAIRVEAQDTAPRVFANLFNPSAQSLGNLVVIAVVRDTEGNIMAASQTVIERLSPQSSEEIIFAWNEPFPRPSGRIDIRAVVSLP